MATVTFTVTLPDDKLDALMDAMRNHYGDMSMTAGEVRTQYEVGIIRDLRRIYKKHQREIAEQAIDDILLS